MKYSLIMPFWRRHVQFQNTLVSLCHWYKHRDDWEVVVVLDKKQTTEEIESFFDICDSFPTVRFNVVGQDDAKETWHCPSVHWNTGVQVAKGEYVIITNPENFHSSDIFHNLDKHFQNRQDAFVVCSCLSVFSLVGPIKTYSEFQFLFHTWYQHSKECPRDLNFCTALSKKEFIKFGGFDENFKYGMSYDDDDFRNSAKKAGLFFIRDDDALTLHINHDRGHRCYKKHSEHLERNRVLYESKWGK